MKEILWLIVLAIILGAIIDGRDSKLTLNELKQKEKFFTFILIVFLVFFCGLRTWYNDTVTYIQIFEQTPLLSEFWGSEDASLAKGIGFGFLNSVMKTMGFLTQDYLMFYAILSVVPLVIFIRKYAVSMKFAFFLMFATGYYMFTMAAIKQCVATAFCLCAVMCAEEKKWGKYILLVCLGILFHPYALVYFLVPLMNFRPWTVKTFMYMFVFILIGFMLDRLLGVVIDVTSMIGADYSVASFAGEGVSVFRVVVAFVPMILAFLYGPNLFNSASRADYLMFNLSMLNALIMFVGLFGTANYFARLANYFLPAQIIVIPWVLNRATPKDKKWLVPLCVICYMGYCYYEYGILRSFDDVCTQMSIWEYLIH